MTKKCRTLLITFEYKLEEKIENILDYYEDGDYLVVKSKLSESIYPESVYAELKYNLSRIVNYKELN